MVRIMVEYLSFSLSLSDVRIHAYHTMAHGVGDDGVRAAGVQPSTISTSASRDEDGCAQPDATSTPARRNDGVLDGAAGVKRGVLSMTLGSCDDDAHVGAAGVQPGVISNSVSVVQGDGSVAAGLPACSPATSSSPRAMSKATASWWQGCWCVAR
jgi:hypothetical protein